MEHIGVSYLPGPYFGDEEKIVVLGQGAGVFNPILPNPSFNAVSMNGVTDFFFTITANRPLCPGRLWQRTTKLLVWIALFRPKIDLKSDAFLIFSQ